MKLKQFVEQNGLLVLATFVIASVPAIYWKTYSRIVEMWSISDYEYGWLVFPICFYILVRKRPALANIRWRTSSWGVLLAGVLVVTWIVALAVGVQALEFVSVTLLIFALYWALAGTEAMRTLVFPLLFLLAAVPLGGFLVDPLTRITAELSALFLNMTGVPVLREGQFFDLPGGSFEVAIVCNGLRYLLASTLLSLAYSYFAYTSISKRLLFVSMVAIVMVITNGVRAFIVMYVASATTMKVLGGYDHVVFGIILFAIVFIAMLLIGERFAEPGKPISSGDMKQPRREKGLSFAICAGALAIVGAGPIFAAAMVNRSGPNIYESPPPKLYKCYTHNVWEGPGVPEFSNADFELRELFSCDNYKVGVFIASYGVQGQGKELISWGNRVWPYDWRRFVDQSTMVIDVGGDAIEVQEVLVRHPDGWRLTWFWYQIGPFETIGQVNVKLLEAFQTVTFRPVESSIVALSAISTGEDNVALLREQLTGHMTSVRNWNRERMRLGSGNVKNSNR